MKMLNIYTILQTNYFTKDMYFGSQRALTIADQPCNWLLRILTFALSSASCPETGFVRRQTKFYSNLLPRQERNYRILWQQTIFSLLPRKMSWIDSFGRGNRFNHFLFTFFRLSAFDAIQWSSIQLHIVNQKRPKTRFLPNNFFFPNTDSKAKSTDKVNPWCLN